jgi:MFS family permease
MLSTIRLRVFILFAVGYFVSYVVRGLNIGFAPFITHDLGLSAADLGLLTSLYFLGFAAAQIPGGMLLDRFGPRRVNAGLLLVAAAGMLLFGVAPNLATMMLGRLLIGIGASTCLGGAFKALAQHFPPRHLPLLNGLTMAVGGLGGVVVGSPLSWLLTQAGWRMICAGLAAFIVAVAVAIWVGAPETQGAEQRDGIVSQFKGTLWILNRASFWKTASFSAMTQGVFYATQSLWVGAYLRDASAVPASEAAALVSTLGLAMMAGCVSFGLLAKALERRGLSVHAFCGIGMMVFVVDQLLIILHAPLPAAVLWVAYGFFGGTGILSYAVLAEQVPAPLIGRSNTTFTLIMFVLIFGFQVGIGAVVSLWPARDGHYPAEAHQIAWSLLVALQGVGAIWYFWPERRRTVESDRFGHSSPRV